jgi:prepilin-type N-terminal cleavage/methylation domain-containing protein/prepilin-type processing-associated H-X9-DG protein
MIAPRMHDIGRRTACRGFTLVELLVVISIIGVLVSLLLPAVQGAREAARRSQCVNNLKQIALALSSYESMNKVFPPGRMGFDGWNTEIAANQPGYCRPGTSGFVMILPFLEQQTLYNQFEPFARGALYPSVGPNDQDDGTTTGWQTTQIAQAVGVRPAVFVCPSNTSEPKYGSLATGNYALCMGSRGPSTPNSGTGVDGVLLDGPIGEHAVKHQNTGVFHYRSVYTAAEIRDGLSNTIFVGEVIQAHTQESANRWLIGSRHLDCLRSTDNPLNTPPTGGVALDLYGYKCSGAFASRHAGGASFAFGDGHVANLARAST